MGKRKVAADVCSMILSVVANVCVVLIVIETELMGFAKIAIGARLLYGCSIEYLIPIWLIVSGWIPSILSVIGILMNKDYCKTCAVVSFGIVLLFYFVWLICGSVWVYTNYGKVTGADCDQTLITFAFAAVTLDWICIGLFIFSICIFACADALEKSSSTINPETTVSANPETTVSVNPETI